MTAPVVILAATSARMLAQSALRGGFKPVSLDLFGDVDTRRAGHWIGIGNRTRSAVAPRRLQVALARLARVPGVRGWIAGGGFEDRLELLRDASRILTLLGNDAGTIARVKAPDAFFGSLDRFGIAHPAISLEPPASPDGGWLVKRVGGTGGWHVRRWVPTSSGVYREAAAGSRTADGGLDAARPAHRGTPKRLRTRSTYFQREEAGTPMSALFLANGRDCMLIGCNRLLAGDVAERPFVFQGAIGPVRLPAGADEAVRGALRCLTRHFGLKGLNSLDFLLDDDRVSVLEINPRPSATMQIHENRLPGGLLGAHLRACSGHDLPPEASLAAGAVSGMRIIYAWRRLTMSPACCRRLQSLGWCHDIGREGSRADRGDPLCTITAAAVSEPAVVAELARRTTAIECIWEEEHEREIGY